MCKLTRSSSLTALAALLAELLFTRGGECSTLDDLLQVYQQHFGVPLLLKHFGVDSILSLIELPELKEIIKLVDIQVSELERAPIVWSTLFLLTFSAHTQGIMSVVSLSVCICNSCTMGF